MLEILGGAILISKQRQLATAHSVGLEQWELLPILTIHTTAPRRGRI